MRSQVYLMMSMLMLAFAVLLVGCGDNQAGSLNGAEAQFIQTRGEAEIKAEPDLAEVSVGIVTRSFSAEEAARDNAVLANAVLDALLNYGLQEEDLRTGTYRLQSQQLRPGQRPPVEPRPETDVEEPAVEREEPGVEEEEIYYQATNEIVISATQLDNLGEIVDTAIGAGANHVNYVSFDLEDPQALKMQALGAATEQALRKAEAIAESAGETINRLHSIEEEITDFTPFRMREEMIEAPMAEDAESTPIEPDEVTVRAAVTAKFTF